MKVPSSWYCKCWEMSHALTTRKTTEEKMIGNYKCPFQNLHSISVQTPTNNPIRVHMICVISTKMRKNAASEFFVLITSSKFGLCP